MGVDLRLLPVHHLHADSRTADKSWGFSHVVLSVPRNRAMWKEIELLNPSEIPDGCSLSSYVTGRVPDGRSAGELMYGWTAKDAYDCKRTWIRAADLRPVFDRIIPGHPVTAYLNAMDGAEMVILDWC